MKTDDLIQALAADTAAPALSLRRAGSYALVSAVVLAALAFFAMLGPRPDFSSAVETSRFLFKFVVTLALAATSFVALLRLAVPGALAQSALRLLWVAPLLLITAVLIELSVMPRDSWMPRLIGTNSILCMTFIPLIAIGPLVAFALFLRQGAPPRPSLSGAVAGLAAGGLAAFFYAAHCPDDSPLFVATWYTLAVAGLTIIGAASGRVFARW